MIRFLILVFASTAVLHSQTPMGQPLDSPSGKKSPLQAGLYSLLLPGMGERYLGTYQSGKYFTIAEGALWLTWGSFRSYSAWVKNDARNFAAQSAGVIRSGKNDQYFIDIGNFRSVHDYNEQAQRDRDPHKVYDPASSYFWEWETDQQREEYRQLRVSSDRALNNSKFVVAAIIVNHVASAVNAVRQAIVRNNDQSAAISTFPQVHAEVLDGPLHPQGILLTLSASF